MRPALIIINIIIYFCLDESFEDSSNCPFLNATFVVPSFEFQKSLLTPLRAPTILDGPKVLLSLSIMSESHQNQGVVRPIRAHQRICYSALVVHHPCEIEQNRKGSSFIESIFDDCLIVGNVQVSLDLHSWFWLIEVARTGIIFSEGVVVIGHQSSIPWDPVNRVVGPSSVASIVGDITVDQLLHGKRNECFFLQIVDTFNVASCAEGPTTSTWALISDGPNRILVSPIPVVRGILLRLVVRVIRKVFDIIKDGLLGDD